MVSVEWLHLDSNSLSVVDEVDWVQCDGPCEGWLHQLCAGIRNPGDIEHLEKWFCPTCSSDVEPSVVGAAEALLSMAGLVEPSSVSVLNQVASSSLLNCAGNLEQVLIENGMNPSEGSAMDVQSNES